MSAANRMGSGNRMSGSASNKNKNEEMKEPAPRTGAQAKPNLGGILNSKPLTNNRPKPALIPQSRSGQSQTVVQ